MKKNEIDLDEIKLVYHRIMSESSSPQMADKVWEAFMQFWFLTSLESILEKTFKPKKTKRK